MCVKPSHKNRKRKHCVRLTRVRGQISQKAAAGRNTLIFNGKVAGHPLSPGGYQLTATPSGGAPQRTTFKLLQ